MNDTGLWWYDQQVAMGTTRDPSNNTDMISPAFWLVSGREFKITRSDDLIHTPLLQTTGNCLAGQTFRTKITSYGSFINGKSFGRLQVPYLLLSLRPLDRAVRMTGLKQQKTIY